MAAGIEDIIIVTRRYNRAIEDLNSNIVYFLTYRELYICQCRNESNLLYFCLYFDITKNYTKKINYTIMHHFIEGK